MQTQRTILWIVFSMSLLFLWDSWQRYNGKPSFFGGPPATTQTTAQNGSPPAGTAGSPNAIPSQGGAAGAAPDASVPALPQGTAPAAGNAPAGQAAVPGAAGGPTVGGGQVVKLANDVLALSIDTQGAQVTRADLLQHKEIVSQGGGVLDHLLVLVHLRPAPPRPTPHEHVILLENQEGRVYVAQSGLIGAPAGSSFPTHKTSFTLAEPPATHGDTTEVKLAAESGGVRLVRTYSLTKGSYVIGVKDEVTNIGSTPIKPTLYQQLTRDGSKPPGESQVYSTYTGPAVYTEKSKFQKVDFGSIENDKASFERSADNGWVGIIQHYFLAAWIPPESKPREFFARKIETNLYAVGALEPLPEIAPGATASHVSRLLVGPQDQRMLEKVAPGLDLSVDYGWLTVIAKPIYWLLETLHRFVGNWGWAIVLLTIIIKTLFFPLQAASYRSMARMKAVTPRLTQIRERYGNDRAKMNQAMMELYRQEKINPLGGCLPIVVQIPVFIALYWVLLASVEMRNAPWLGWIHDLAAPDPFYILPLIMAATMFIQTKLNPTPPDPVQAKMMMIMPLVFSVMFFFFPAGLVLYWLVNNLYSIAQQYAITRAMGDRPGGGGKGKVVAKR